MELKRAVYGTLKNKRFWKWELGSLALYAIPAAIRFIRKNPYIPILNTPGWSPTPYIPPNLVEKFFVNAFFPGGSGAVAGETFFTTYKDESLKGKTKYLSRLAGALTQYSVWTMIQYVGYLQKQIGPHGENIFESPEVIPFNLLLALFSIFTPDVLYHTKSKIGALYKKLANKC
jgi:hypothetical protein